MRRLILDFVNLRERKLSLKSLLAPLFRWRNGACTRLSLIDLNDRMLRDIGLTRHELLRGGRVSLRCWPRAEMTPCPGSRAAPSSEP
ncbi:MAG TPA: DUF1127 domain-containing protein [Gammaproteobacteria bacterium]|nr:DUF1127 domain-containing protein [Gammaproteobacteria bacterium]